MSWITSNQTYARTRSDGVPDLATIVPDLATIDRDLATIDRRHARPVHIETTAAIHQEK